MTQQRDFRRNDRERRRDWGTAALVELARIYFDVFGMLATARLIESTTFNTATITRIFKKDLRRAPK